MLLGGVKAAAVNGTVLCGTADAHNTFTAPNAVQPKALPAVLTADGFTAALPAKKRTPDAEYAARLACCKACDALNAGTCMQCGCYVEMRAARLDMHCPKEGQW